MRAAVEAQLELLWYCCGSVFCDIESAEDDVLQKVNVRQKFKLPNTDRNPVLYRRTRSNMLPLRGGGGGGLDDDSEHLLICVACLASKKEKVVRRGKKHFKPKE